MKNIIFLVILMAGMLKGYDAYVIQPREEKLAAEQAEKQAAYERSPEYIKASIKQVAKEYKLSPALALAIAEVESTFNPDALREEKHKNSVSVGLFQMFLPTAKDMGFKGTVEELKNPATNIEIGVKYLAKCQAKLKTKDVRRLACCHNAGLYTRESVCKNDGWVVHYQNKVEKAYRKYQSQKISVASL